MNTNRQKVEALRILSEINNNELVSVSEAVQSIPGGESCVVSANTGLHGPIGFQLRLETDRQVSEQCRRTARSHKSAGLQNLSHQRDIGNAVRCCGFDA